MSRLKKWIKISLLFLGLVIIGFAPIVMTHIKNKQLIGQIYKDRLQDKPYMDIEKLEVVDKLRLIINARSEQSGIISRQELLQRKDMKEIEEVVVGHFKQLQTMNILPNIDFNQEYISRNISKITYLDIDNPLNAVNTWDLFLEFPNFNVQACFDIETSLIYEFFIIFPDDKEERSNEVLSPDKYIAYLNINPKNINYKASELGGYYIYTDEIGSVVYRYENYDNEISFRLEY